MRCDCRAPLLRSNLRREEHVIDGIYEKQSTGCGPATTVTKYYMAFGRAIASRVNGVLSYCLADHLGSTTQQIDATNTPGAAIKYYPFATPRNGTASPERAYTGQQREDASASYHVLRH